MIAVIILIHINIMEKYLYTIGEAADILGESTSLVRFWANEFPKFIKPQRNAKGNRLFTKEDIETLKHIHLLVKVEGLTLEGAAKRLKGDRKEVINKARVLESLKAIRTQLEEIRSEL
jgi:DNA-binding transcriptional MerR regulator